MATHRQKLAVAETESQQIEQTDIKATRKQKLALAELVADSSISTAEAMRRAGYSHAMTRHAERLTESIGWQELTAQYLPDVDLLKTAQQGLTATKLTRFKDDPDKTYEEVDYYARHQYLQTGLKIRGLGGESTPPIGDLTVNIVNYYDTDPSLPSTPSKIEIKAKTIRDSLSAKPTKTGETGHPLKSAVTKE